MIEIINRQSKYKIRKKVFYDLLTRFMEHYNLPDAELSLVFVNNREIRKLNNQFLNRNSYTDVLSFPIGEKGSDEKYYLGDIVISVPQALKQCLHEEHGLERELELLTLHGFLHLLGYDHDNKNGIEKEEEKMQELMFEGNHGN